MSEKLGKRPRKENILDLSNKMQVRRNIMFAKAGGTAGKNSKNYRISLPADMVRELGVTEEDRSVTLTCEDGKIVIEKDSPEK